MNKKETIVFFSGFYIPFLGGIERYTQKLVTELEKNYNIIIVTSNHDNLSSIENKENIKIIRLEVFNIFKKRYPIFKNNKNNKLLLKELKKYNIKQIICNTRFQLTTYIGTKYAKKNNIPCFIIEHGSGHFTVNNKVLDFFGEIYEHILTNIIKKRCQNYYGVSNRCNNWLKHFKIEAKGVLYNSVDSNAYELYKEKHYLKNNKKIIISYAGRIIKEKGIEELIKAYQEINRNYLNSELLIAGTGPFLPYLKETYQDKQIKFLNKLNYDEVMSLYNDTDIFVYPSMYAEGLPTSILEAGIMKCATIATDRGGTIEVINNKNIGIIVEENIKSIKDNLDKLLENEKLRDKLKENIYNRVKSNFTWQETAKKVEKIMNGKNKK